MYKLRTVDVWDTLLRRDCHPESIKLATARHLLLSNNKSLLAEYSGQWELYQARIDAEKLYAEQARALGLDDEYEITAVISKWVSIVFGSGGYDEDTPHSLVEYELKTEMAHSYPDAGIISFLQSYPAERTLFLSDFYMNSKMLERLLDAKGLRQLVENGLASCDVGMNKRSGKLFEYVHKTYGIAPEDHIHIGDNQWSDIASAQRLGIKAIHYLPELEHALRLKREQLFLSRNMLFAHLRNISRIEAEALLTTQKQGEGPAAFMLGIEAAPLFIGFSTWIAEQSLRHDLDTVLFLTREGEFFHQVYSTLFPEGVCSGHVLPSTHIFPVSRLSTFAASLKEPTLTEISRSWRLFNQQRLSALFLQLGLDISEFSETLKNLGLSANDLINDPSENIQLRILFNEPKICSALTLSIDKNKTCIRDLLKQSGVKNGMKVGIVDIGWRGTIQDNLALAEPNVKFHGMYLGLRRLINKQPINVTKEAYGPNENADDTLNALFEVFSALEMLCSSPNGSVSGYQRKDDVISPVRDVTREENITFTGFTSHFQKGVVCATQLWRPLLDAYNVNANELRAPGLKVWDVMRLRPPQSLASIFMQTPQHDIFGFGEIFSRNQVPSMATVFMSPFLGSKRQKLIEFVRRVQWTAAIDNMQDLSWLHRKVLLITFQAANEIKLLRMTVKYKWCRHVCRRN